MSIPTIIGTTGFGMSGGSATTNILEEFSNIYGLKTDMGGASTFECKFFTENIFALENALKTDSDIDYAIKKFLYNAKQASQEHLYIKNFGNTFLTSSFEYIDKISNTYLGGIYKKYDYTFLKKEEKKHINYTHTLYDYLCQNREYNEYEPYPWVPGFAPFGKVYYADFDEAFYKITQEYIQKVFLPLYNHFNGGGYILADALYRTNTAPSELRYFNKSKALMTNRDPRDLYVMNKELYGEWFIPTWDVDKWIKYYRHRRKCIKPQKEHNTSNILHLQFEELIYDYENSLTKIKDFLSLNDEQHIKKGKIFIPEKSKQNTQVFRKYPKYIKDIEKIEKELSEFCYNYSENQVRYFTEEEVKSTRQESLEDIRKTVCIFQKTGKLPFSILKGTFIFSTLYKYIKSFKNRKGIKSIIKGIIKVFFAVIYFPIEFFLNLFNLKKYYKLNNHRKVEFK